MEQREAAQGTLENVEARLVETRDKLSETEARRDQALAEIAKEEQFKTQARKPLVADLPADLVALYDRIRETSGGIGAAPLTAGRCGGCRLELSGADRARIKAAPPDEVVRCEECRCILVRTAESGL
jgi:predicted  nucleic acid-binding Zn-ribbon protein